MADRKPIVLDFDAEKVPDAADVLWTEEPLIASRLIDVVERGLELVSTMRPDWHQAIWLDRLDLRSSKDDILGQLYGDYESGLREVGLFLAHRPDMAEKFGSAIDDRRFLFDAALCGLCLPPDLAICDWRCRRDRCAVEARWDALIANWVDAIRYRFRWLKERGR